MTRLHRRRSAWDLQRVGLYFVNRSYPFTKALAALLEPLRTALAPEGHRREITAEWLG